MCDSLYETEMILKDFDEYVNGQWNKNTKIPEDKSEWGTFSIIHDDNKKKIKAMLENLIHDPENKYHIVGKLYQYLVNGQNDQINLRELLDILQKISNIKNLSELGTMLGYLVQIEVYPFFQISASEDPMDTQMIRLCAWAPNLSLPEKNYYIEKKYSHYVVDLEENIRTVNEFIYENDADPMVNNYNYASDVIYVETLIANALQSVETRRDVEKIYNKTNIGQFIESMRDGCKKIPENFLRSHTLDNVSDFWINFFITAGLRDIDLMIIHDLSFFRKISMMLNMLDIKKIKEYVKYVMIRSMEKTLISDLDSINFEFYGKKLHGQNNDMTRDQLVIDMLSKNIGQMIGRQYIDVYFDQKAKPMVTEIVQNIKQQMYLSIKNSKWMSVKTRNNAMSKLEKIRTKIGYPDVWKNYDDLINDLNLGWNEKISSFRLINDIKTYNYKKNVIHLSDSHQDPEKWSMCPQDVNAYYDPQRNEMVFPAGILVPPFFDDKPDTKQSLGKNYGGIGTVIGHEITHGYDDQGRKFDQDGNLSNQWDPMDVEKYNAFAKKMIEQYDSYMMDGNHVNGKLTLGENIADLGGVVLAFRALCKKLSKYDQDQEFVEQQKKEFFMSYANLWKNVTKPDKRLSQLLSDPHSPGKYRVWVLRNVNEFYETFANTVKSQHQSQDPDQFNTMYLRPGDRIEIW
jgi:putative endopeptidase